MGTDELVHRSCVDGSVINQQNGVELLVVIGRRRPNFWIGVGQQNEDEHQPIKFGLAVAAVSVLRDVLGQHPTGRGDAHRHREA